MVEVTRLNGSKYYLNPNIIEVIEKTPDTVIKLINDKKLIVIESPTEIIDSIIKYNREIFLNKTRVE